MFSKNAKYIYEFKNSKQIAGFILSILYRIYIKIGKKKNLYFFITD